MLKPIVSRLSLSERPRIDMPLPWLLFWSVVGAALWGVILWGVVR